MESRPLPFDYQSEALTAVDEGWKEFRKQLVVIPTGGGKTALFCWMAEKELKAGNRTLIIVDQDELISQTLEKLIKFTNIIADVEQGPSKASLASPVVVATNQSLCRRLDRWPANHFSLVIADEADRSLADTWQRSLQHFAPHALICGFTATPLRSDKRNLGEFYEHIPIQLRLIDLINKGYLSKICIQMLPLRIDLSAVHTKDGDYDKDELDHAITPYLSSAIEYIHRTAEHRKTLAFLPLIRTSEAFVSIAKGLGLKAEHIDGSSDDRKEKLKRFKRREFSIIANSQLLARGYDDPDIDTISMLSPTKSVSLYQQKVGRGTRLFAGKDYLLLYDFLFQSQKNLVCRPANLIAETQEQADFITQASLDSGAAPIDLMTLVARGGAAREESLRRQLESVAKRKAQFISADQFSIMHDQIEAVDYEPTFRYERKPPSDKQIKYLKEANIDVDTVRGWKHAGLLLDKIFELKNSQPASKGQRYLMFRDHWRSADGTRNAWQATAGEAREFFINRGKQIKSEKKHPQREFNWE